jgi:uroporphyrinogen III methyltransferase/synthase
MKTRHVLVTAAAETAAILAAELRRCGMRPLSVPTIATYAAWDFPSAHQASLRWADWIVITSRAAVRHTSELLGGARTTHIAAVGPATAHALRMKDVEPDYVGASDSCDGRTLAQLLPVKPGEHVLLPRSDIANPDVERILRQRGARVQAFVAYRTRGV